MAGHPDELGWAAGARTAVALSIAVVLAGCDALPGLGGRDTDGTGAAQAQPQSLASGDFEAPDVFNLREPGLWDGRPSLGGVWVAHPDATDPERVRIVNEDNGQEIVGALFRRERDLPGPALQVSSDAAAALGMLAGAPATLRVTALRRAEAPGSEGVPEATDAASPGMEESPIAEATSVASEAMTADPVANGAVAAATAAIIAGAAVAPAPAADVATAPLDSATSGTSTASLQRPFVQLGTYQVEAFAQDTARVLADEGLAVRVVPDGDTAWRLLLGPATTEAEQAALLQRAVAEGFADAYLVSR